MKTEAATRAEAKALGLETYRTGKPCVRGHLEKRSTKYGFCYECSRERARAFAKDNPEKVWRNTNKDKANAYARQYTTDHREKLRAWRQGRHEHRNALRRANYQKNKAPYYAQCRKRQASKLNATPAWLTAAQRKEIEAMYATAIALTELLGEPHEVDHIYPLRGKTSCGLHVPWNLQVITKRQNRAKGSDAPS